jgi:hypothetical protein
MTPKQRNLSLSFVAVVVCSEPRPSFTFDRGLVDRPFTCTYCINRRASGRDALPDWWSVFLGRTKENGVKRLFTTLH